MVNIKWKLSSGLSPQVLPRVRASWLESSDCSSFCNIDSDDSDDSVEADELDPPRGIGLRFDEIEQMIDEVLETDDS